MHLLHITDLHVTEPGQTLETLWISPRARIGEDRFDAIVVSGDLTQAGRTDEYQNLRSFTEKALLPLLVEPQRERIIFVPGNHDVSWDGGTLDPVRLPWFGSSPQLQKEVAELRRDPTQSTLRIRDRSPGRYDLLRVGDEHRYRTRYGRCQQFLSDFYSAGPGAPEVTLKPFDLLTPGEDWSAHRFIKDEVAFFGFNSCFRNDRYWHGAGIDHKAIFRAQSWRKQHCDGLLAVAVWHHGLIAQQGRPDYLTFEDLGQLQEAGFQVGFHGHVHQAMSHMVPILREDFPLIGTGSLGAGDPDRPGSVGQQFAIVDLHPTRVTVKVYERSGPGKQYEFDPRRSRRLQIVKQANKPAGARARRHQRSWVVDQNGVCHVTVGLDHLEIDGECVLGHLNPPFCSVDMDKTALCDGVPVPVTTSIYPDGRYRFTLKASPGEHRELRWRYWVSNAIVTNRAEFDLLEPVQSWFRNVPPKWDIRCHTVRIDTEELVLSVEFAPVTEGPQAAIDSVDALVESKVGDEDWRVEKKEKERCRVEVLKEHGNRRAVLRVRAPVVGFRYGLLFRPRFPGYPYRPEELHLSQTLLDRFRRTGADALRHESAVWLAGQMKSLFDEDPFAPYSTVQPESLLGEGGAWLGLLWHAEERRLFPAFGHFPPNTWGNWFAAGSGIAGHAFRRSGTMTWYKNMGPGRLLYQDRVAPHSPKDTLAQSANSPARYDWIVCVPIYLGRAKAARSIGVVSFAGRGVPSTSVASELESLAHSRANTSPALGLEPGLTQIETRLETAVNAAFWLYVRKKVSLDGPDDKTARRIYEAILGKRK